jgi:hypothetical protein
MRLLPLVWILCFTATTWAQADPVAQQSEATTAVAVSDSDGNVVPPQDPNGTAQPQSHPVATTYSNGYQVRLKIHKYASFATLPLFVTELALGQSLYNTPETGGKKTAHAVVGTGIVGLFAANTVTGVWNLWEGRNDTDGRKLRILHSVLMMAANGGFVATTATAPSIHRGSTVLTGNKALHRDLAIGSIGVGTVGYVIMLFRGK